MSKRRAEFLAWGLWALFLAMGTGSAVVSSILHPGPFSIGDHVIILPFLLFATVGAVVASRRPENRIGWLYLTIGVLSGFTAMGEALQYTDFPAGGMGRVGFELLWVLTNAAWYPTLALLATLAILWFPDGRPPTRRWRWVEIGVAVGIVTVTLAFALAPGPLNGKGSPANPIGISGAEPILGAVQGITGVLLIVLIGASITAFVVRFRRSGGVERQQLKWFLAGAVILGVGITINIVVQPEDDVLFALATSAVPLSAGIAITRYRLYDLDRLISRAVAYLAVSAVLVAVYAGIVVGIGALTGRTDSPILIAGATLAVAALVRPVVRRAKGVIDRRFYRRRYDSQRALEAFAAGLRDEVALEQVRGHLLSTVHETMQPAKATVWLRGTGMSS
jgi:hypothetical protein